MAFDVEAAKAAGYTQADIDEYLRANPKSAVSTPVAPGQEVDPGEPPPPPKEEYVQAGEGNYMPAIGTVAAAAAPYVIPAVATGAGLYGAAKVGGFGRDMLNTAREGMEAYKTGVNTANEIAQRNVALQQAKMAERAARGAQPMTQGGPQAFQQMGQQLSQARPAGPVAPAVAPPAPAMAAPVPQAAPQPSMMQRGMDYASKMREVAAQRVLPVMGQAGQMAGRGLAAVANSPVTRLGGMAANAMYSGDLNANEAAELERRRKMAPTITR